MLGLHLHMPKLPCHALVPAQDLPVHKDPNRNALRHIQHHQSIVRVAISKPDLRQRAGIRHVVDLHRQPRSLLDIRLQIDHRPIQSRRKHQRLRVRISPTRQTNPNPHKRDRLMLGNQMLDPLPDRRQRLLRIQRQVDPILCQNLPRQIRYANRRPLRMNIQHNHPALLAQLDKNRPPPPRQLPNRPFKQPFFIDQLFNNQRDRAPSQPAPPRQFCT